MLKDGNEWYHLPEFLVEAEMLLAKSEECLSHLHLIRNDQDAILCMLGILLKLSEKADARSIRALAEFSLQVHGILKRAQDQMDLNDQLLIALKDCLTLMAWQLELIDPVSGQLGLDQSEQAALVAALAAQVDQPPTLSRSLKVVSVIQRNA